MKTCIYIYSYIHRKKEKKERKKERKKAVYKGRTIRNR